MSIILGALSKLFNEPFLCFLDSFFSRNFKKVRILGSFSTVSLNYQIYKTSGMRYNQYRFYSTLAILRALAREMNFLIWLFGFKLLTFEL